MFWEAWLLPWGSGSPVTTELNLLTLFFWGKNNLAHPGCKILAWIIVGYYNIQYSVHFLDTFWCPGVGHAPGVPTGFS